MPFDFTLAVREFCEDVCNRLPVFGHVRMDEVAVTFAQARCNVAWGLQAKLTPMRFEGGTLHTRRHGRTWTVQRLYAGEREMLYILTFYLPRFQEQTFREKLITVLHELYHIGPAFDGDIRRHDGRYHVHSHSQREYDAHMGRLVDEYLATGPPPERYDFLRSRFATLSRRHGGIVGTRVAIPKLIPLDQARSA
jgi:hypothetical protein